jgi:hypothetical protein
MNITKDIISDLIPLYVANECSTDTRVLIEEYLRQHPQEAAELRRIMRTPMPGAVPAAKNLEEMESLRKARHIIRRRSWVLAFAIFFSLTPLSFLHTGGHTYWFFREAPGAAAIYGTLGIIFWVIYFILRNRSQTL